jgi:hypothetical protein
MLYLLQCNKILRDKKLNDKGAGTLFMENPPNETSLWRLLLREYIRQNPDAKKEIAKYLKVSVRSVERWIEPNSKTNPNPAIVPELAKVVPGRESEMLLSLQSDYPEAFETADLEMMPNIPAAFYSRVLAIRSSTAHNLRKSTIMGTVYRQMAGHLDPDGKGLLLLFARCVPPSQPEGDVEYLEIAEGYGTNQWRYKSIRPFLIGKHSLCEKAVKGGDVALLPDVARLQPVPIPHSGDLLSCAAFPISLDGDPAGAVIVGAPFPMFFSESRCELISQYMDLFAIAFDAHEFYPVGRIKLKCAPAFLDQSAVLHSQQLFDDLVRQYPEETPDQHLERAQNILKQNIISRMELSCDE